MESIWILWLGTEIESERSAKLEEGTTLCPVWSAAFMNQVEDD